MIINNPNCALVVDPEASYPEDPPFDPDQAYPEFGSAPHRTSPNNRVYESVREVLRLLELDRDNIGTPRWNPFQGFVRSGDTVFIKPNLVLHEVRETLGTNCVYTHGSVIRPLIDYCLLATNNNVRIIVGDVPLQSADFDAIVAANGLRDLVGYFREERKVDVQLLDLRPFRQRATEEFFFEQTIEQAGDPKGYSSINLGERSWLQPLCGKKSPRFAVTDYENGETSAHHKPGVHEYFICRTALDADVFINVPKLKTHEKAGMTGALKNIVGINAQKSWLPHYRKGSVAFGGDEWARPSIRKWAYSHARSALQGRNRRLWVASRWIWHRMRPSKELELSEATETFFELGGAWHGNDTVWRMVLDLNSALFFYDSELGFLDRPRRRYFCLADGIVVGEGRGPLFPRPNRAGCLIGSWNPVVCDTVGARVMGFDWEKIPLLRNAYMDTPFALTPLSSPEEIVVATQNGPVPFSELDVDFACAPAPGWRGAIEIEQRREGLSVG